VQVPIQVVNADYGSVPTSCGTPDVDPAAAGFTGILGVGPFPQDCGSSCVSSACNGMYFRCTGASYGSSQDETVCDSLTPALSQRARGSFRKSA
jgi:hypothetical protein